MTRSIMIKSVLPAVVVLVLALAAGFAWGRTSQDSPSVAHVADRGSATSHNAADVRFAQMMVPHHRQAVGMAALAPSRAGSSGVRALAEKIAGEQQPEIDAMTSWLDDWHASTSGGQAMSGMPGMMSSGDMTALGQKTGAAFDKSFLTMMIGHHTGALTMARTELADGRSAPALALAASIEVSQQAEIRQMRGMLG